MDAAQDDAAPLAGIRVLDLSRVLAGPWATQLLADLGADVIKVKRPAIGDDTRAWGPPFFEGPDGAREAAYFTCANRGKRSVEIDLASAEGAEQIRRLATESDVLVENFKVGDLARHGLDYASLKQANPRLIYCSISGFGQTGSHATRPGYDFVMQAMGGLMSITGEPGGEPMKAGVALVDIMTGLYASNAILAALQRRERTGIGGDIDVALFDVQVATLANQAANYLATGRAPGRLGNAHPNIVPYQTFRCADGEIAVAVGNDRQFRHLCAAIGRPDLGADPAYATNALRVENRAALIDALSAQFATEASGPLIERLERDAVPAGPVNDIGAVMASVQARDRMLETRTAHAALGRIPTIACPIRLDGRQMIADRGIPSLGEHNAILSNR
jgi:crotonobetainyl-CoA:carnitine CoA-transferase CaiB-like acyl-CoA transferase